MYVLEAKYELVKMMRVPAFVIPTIGFPLMFYTLFGLLMSPGRSASMSPASYLLATYGAFGVIGISLFALGVGVATERGQGWLAVKRASPMPVSAYFFGKYLMTVVFALVLTILLAVLGTLFGHVHLTATQWVSWTIVQLFGGLPFCAIGIAVGYLVGPNSAPAVMNAIYLPMSFLSGLFIPAFMLPKVLQNVAPVLPPYHLGQLSLKAAGVIPPGGAWKNGAALIGFGVVFAIAAVIAYKRDEGKTYG